MKSIEELAAGATEASDIGTGVQRWREEIIEAARAKRKFEQVAFSVNVPDGVQDYKVPVSDAVDFSSETTTSENTEVSYTDLTGHISSTTFSPEYKRNAVRISMEAIEENAVDVIDFAQNELTQFATKKVDTDLRDELEDNVTTGNLAGGDVLYAGDASDVSGLTSGDILTPDLIAQGLKRLREEDYQSTADQPFVMFVHPSQERALLSNSQFVNAAEYGSDEVVLNGEIGKYLGIKVISTTQVRKYSSGDTDDTDSASWGTDGASVYLFKAERPFGIAWSEQARLDAEEKLDYNEQRIYMGMKYDTGLLQENALVVMKVADE